MVGMEVRGMSKKIPVDEEAFAELIDCCCDGCEARETPSPDESEDIRRECPVVRYFEEYACQIVVI